MENKTPNGAVITRQWFESCKELLQDPADRCAVYEGILSLTFGEEEPQITSPVVKAILTMIKPFVMQDIEKYNARCERNRANATRSHSQPLAATRSHSQPLAPNNNNNNNNNKNNNNNVSLETKSDSEEREKFMCLLIFLKRGCLKPSEEMRVFWNYYASLGWKNKNGAPIVRKVSAAAMWKPQGDLSADLIGCENYAKALLTLKEPCPRAVEVFRGISLKGDELTLRVNMEPDNIPAFEKTCGQALSALLRMYNANTLAYTIVKDTK